jgi:MFS transporter, putative metabolite:H+ symporter
MVGQRLWALVSSAAAVMLTAGLMSFFTLGAFAVLYTYTPETYPTTLRTTGMGSASGWARVGGFIAPYAEKRPRFVRSMRERQPVG